MWQVGNEVRWPRAVRDLCVVAAYRCEHKHHGDKRSNRLVHAGIVPASAKSFLAKVVHMHPPQNLLSDVPATLPEELVQTLFKSASVRIERIVSLGHASPEGFWYDQEQHEWVLLVSGAARLRFEGQEPIEMRPGSYINIPAHTRHQVEWTDPRQTTIWLAVHWS